MEAAAAASAPPSAAAPWWSSRRPRRTAMERRAQVHRAEGRVVQRLLRAFDALDSHRGCKTSRLGAALADTLRPSVVEGMVEPGKWIDFSDVDESLQVDVASVPLVGTQAPPCVSGFLASTDAFAALPCFSAAPDVLSGVRKYAVGADPSSSLGALPAVGGASAMVALRCAWADPPLLSWSVASVVQDDMAVDDAGITSTTVPIATVSSSVATLGLRVGDRVRLRGRASGLSEAFVGQLASLRAFLPECQKWEVLLVLDHPPLLLPYLILPIDVGYVIRREGSAV